MPRPIWRGAISFGMVSIPIKLYTATDSKDISFNLLHKSCHTRIRQQRYCPFDEQVIQWSDVERGYEYSKDQYVVLDEGDFEKVPVKTTHTIEITNFVGLEEVDPQYYERSYYLEPEDVGMKPYVLLRRTLEDTNRAALAKVAIRQKEQLCLLRPRDSLILMQTMFYPDEIRDSSDLSVPSDDMAVSDQELKMAHSLVEMLTTEFNPGEHHDDYREALLTLIEQKVNGAVIAQPPPAQGKVVDLMAALRASVEEIQKERSGREAKAEPETAGTEAARPQRRRRAG
jgi:DNA end-binding protein Ku